MSKEEASALFERIYDTLSQSLHPCSIGLVYTQAAGLLAQPTWHITINGEIVEREEGWQDYKNAHAIRETDKDLEEYADAMRANALSELEGE